ncbi:uncharacterized protein Dwil_GK24172 [Drosophila willistoni]|uniref:Protein krueppel n=1 Tax=Drosophila willistoni TaxID=7260 RepID=B4N144_DROWI|nr:zinc finger protein 883 [Drosophila willistoni]EDW78134.1 uncharacterized protein Dwil_GK24172 [Drosophila willistoni]
MLNLATEGTDTPAFSTANGPSTSAEEDNNARCRLCHQAAETAVNIFENDVDFGSMGSIANLCQNLYGVQYERHELLPERICSRCLELLEDFYMHRKGMEQRELALLAELGEMLKQDAKYRPGLNGNPGIFEPEEGCIIVDVDPDKLSETSEDELYDDDDDENGEVEDEEDEEEEDENMQAQNGDEMEMPLGMDAAQMALMGAANLSQDATMDSRPKCAYLCQFCDLGFTLQSDCQQHEKTSHDAAAPYSCSYCNLRMTTRPQLITHIKTLHDADRPYVCAHCRKSFVRRSDLKKHTIVHTGVRPYTCSVCGKSFSRNTNLTKHMRIHSGVKPFVCQQCPRSFQTSSEMMKHMRSHAEIKPFQCQRCPYSSSRKDKLVAHQQVHNKRDVEQQQQQQQQGQVQLQPQMQPQLQPHMLQNYLYQQTDFTPNKVKPPAQSKSSRNFHCDVCDRSFQRERDLQRHRALHMDTLFSCKICQQGFNRREQLQRHELEAHGPSYTCGVCCISFLHQTELENHFKVHQLQHQMAKSTQEAMNVAAVQTAAGNVLPIPVSMPMMPVEQAQLRPSAADIHFYSNMIPTMNLGFYNETRPEE